MREKNNEQYSRFMFLLKKYLVVLALGVGYFIFIKLTGIRIPCVFYELTDKYCPGCGITRMIMALAEFDFKRAAQCNLLVLFLLPFGFLLFIYKSVSYIKKGDSEMSLFEKIFYMLAFVLCIIFVVLRNTAWGTFLIP